MESSVTNNDVFFNDLWGSTNETIMIRE